MAAVQDGTVEVNIPAQNFNAAQEVSPPNFMQKYGEERDKRIRAEGVKQYLDLRQSEKYSKFIQDPWIDSHTAINIPVPDGGQCKVLIVGAGFGGILFAVKFLQAGFRPEDILLVDPAGGFGGTWYWNRYPGLMCDVESYMYDLHNRAMFQSQVTETVWTSNNEWKTTITKHPKGGKESQHTVHANFVCIAPGLLSNAKLPDVDGIDKFVGHMFHTARWDYDYTGGTPTNPSLTGLHGKKVALVGTGATAVQATASLAKHAGQLYVFQRTPSSVDARNNKDTDSDWFKTSVANKTGWQRERALNFTQFVENVEPKPVENLVNDNWTEISSYSALIGTPKLVTMDNVAQHIEEVYSQDIPRQMRLHQRVDDIVQNPEVAKGLKAWYPSWCKRPCFHDEYLQAFNSPNVTLVDTAGKGIDRVTEKGIEFGGGEYDVDLIIWSTGFRSPALGSVAGKAEITVKGKDGLDMEELNDAGELSTLHGIYSRGFPNMFWTGPLQAGVNANNTWLLTEIATHVATIVAETTRIAGTSRKPIVQPTLEAQENWAGEIASGAVTFAALSGCTPSYLNKESETDRLPMEEQMKAAKFSIWPNGFESYLNLLEKCRSDGGMEGLEVKYVE